MSLALSVWGFLLFLLFLALRQHYKGYRKVWLYPVPVYPWFSSGSKSGPYRNNSRSKTLPAPVTAMASRRKGSTRRPHATGKGAAEDAKAKMVEYRKSAFWVWVERPREPLQEVPAAHTRDHTRDRERDRNPERRRTEQPSAPKRTHTTRSTHPRPPRK